MNRRCAQVIGQGTHRSDVVDWLRKSGFNPTRSGRTAAVAIHLTSQSLPERRTRQLHLYCPASVNALTRAATNQSAIDGLVALDKHTEYPAEVLRGPFDQIVEQVRIRPTVAIGTSVRLARRAHLWGDTHFATGLAAALQRLGWRTEIRTHSSLVRNGNPSNSALIYLRGLRPRPDVDSLAATWFISHDSQIDPTELRNDAFSWAAGSLTAERFDIAHLPQATDLTRFRPTRGLARKDELLFVGNRRGAATRPALDLAVGSGYPLTIVGRGWKSYRSAAVSSEQYLPNDQLPTLYGGYRAVLNDHWPDMAASGNVSNRVFDVLASGGFVITDQVHGLDQLLGPIGGFSTFSTNGSRFKEAVAAAIVDEGDIIARSRSIHELHSFDRRAEVIDKALRPALPSASY